MEAFDDKIDKGPRLRRKQMLARVPVPLRYRAIAGQISSAPR